MLKYKLILKKFEENRGDPSKKGTMQEAMVDAGYSKAYARDGVIKNNKTWQDLMEQYFPDDKLARVHDEGLAATTKDGAPEYFARHKYLDSAYKLKKRYDNTVTLRGGLNILSGEDLEREISSELGEALSLIAGETQEGSEQSGT